MSVPPRDYALVYINGIRREISGEPALRTLLDHLRLRERLTGTKLGCGEGGCGACTVMLSRHDPGLNRIVHRAVNACLVPVAACDGASITTVEAVGDRNGNLAPLQQALVNTHASQCGFCTPGFVMSMYSVLRDRAADPASSKLSDADIYAALDGNLCRCTGYRPILDAFKGVIKHENNDCAEACVLGDKCCRVNGGSKHTGNTDARLEKNASSSMNGNSSVVVDREFVFPPELIGYSAPELSISGGKWLRPVSLSRLLQLKAANESARIVVGNTELGIESKFKNLKVSTYLSAADVPDLISISEEPQGLVIGSSVTWTQLKTFISSAVAAETSKGGVAEYKYNSLKAVQSQLQWFAGNQIRNVAAVGGNIVTASPISDVNPVLMAAGAKFVILDCSTSAKRSVEARDFFKGYRTVDMKASEILLNVVVPWNESETDFTHPFKVSRRREDDIAIVSAGVRFILKERNPGKYRISKASVSYGGLAPQTIPATKIEDFVTGKDFNKSTLDGALQVAVDEHRLRKDVPGGMPEFRQSLAVGFIFKAFLKCATAIDKQRGSTDIVESFGILPDEDYFSDSGAHMGSCGVQIASDRPPNSKADVTGKSKNHLSATLQVSGSATYLDDLPPFFGELQAYPVISSEPNAELVNVDYSEAEGMPGVYQIVRYTDVRGFNKIGQVYDEECFAEREVTTVGHIIALVTADTYQNAKNAAKAVNIDYRKKDAVITIEEAIKAASYAPNSPIRKIRDGNTAAVLKEYAGKGQTVHGCVRIGAQEHWYLETNGTIAVPDENDEMLVIASSQAPSKTQSTVARVLGVPMHKIVCKTKRIGGGFGGKETRNFFLSAATAVAAQATKRPVRFILDRDLDMLMTGTRHAFLANYNVAYEESGNIVALDLKMHLNMGNSFDLSIPVLDRALYHCTNAYDIKNLNIVGTACLTNSASNTAFRGFGAPQGMLMGEIISEHVSWATNVSQHEVRDRNMFGRNGNGIVTGVGMSFNPASLHTCWDEVRRDAEFLERKEAVEAFNKIHSLRKRGISTIPTMYGISFTLQMLNQGGALVHIYSDDGSVLISHGGVEMGQGLHTKVCQVAATELQLPLEKVFISDTATDKVPNSVPTSASMSSDIYGMAVKYACEELNERLKPIKERLGEEAKWEEIVADAFANRVCLSATGFYAVPDIENVNLGEEGSRGRPFHYYTNGAAVSEVEIDTLTGEMIVIRTDIVMDVGRPLNPAIDVGQIEGAFVQGLGWCTAEELVRGSSNAHVWLRPGQMHTLGPGAYKIPASGDIPKDFRVRVLNTWNEVNTIHSSKAIGEPPLFLASSVFFAIRDAITSARRDRGLTDFFQLDSPATVERIRLACANDVLDRVAGSGTIPLPSLTL